MPGLSELFGLGELTNKENSLAGYPTDLGLEFTYIHRGALILDR